MTKYIFVTGGVVSALGKGIATASIGLLLKKRGLAVSLQKFDPYINVDPGTMSPFQHGEVFVTDDGAETDLDLGHYERFTDETLSQANNLTAGQIYNSVINQEREGTFLGGTVQVVPHITGEIKKRVYDLGRRPDRPVDVVITEVGGTVGDIESLPFLEAIRQLGLEVGRGNVCYIHLTLVPYVRSAGEFKTKPTQHSVKELRSIGIQPDILLCRAESSLPRDAKDKMALFCNVRKEAVIEAIDVSNVYEVPLIFHRQDLDTQILRTLETKAPEPDLADWQGYVERARAPEVELEIGLCGKYVRLHDAYKSVLEAIGHAATANRAAIKLRWVDTEQVEQGNAARELAGLAGIVIPGGFGVRGILGKTEVIRYAREQKVPFLGLCVGLQCAVIEFARNVCGLARANSTEFDSETPDPVIDFLPGQREITRKGATMRLGAYPARLAPGSLARRCYGRDEIRERHRHRYEVNPAYVKALSEHGMIPSGTSPDGKLVEIVELKDHPYFVATQFHPEFLSRPLRPHPLFDGLIKSARTHAGQASPAGK